MVRSESHGAPLTSGEKANGEVEYSVRADLSREMRGVYALVRLLRLDVRFQLGAIRA